MIYLDNAAMQPPKQECIDTAVDVWKNHWGNPSSIYEHGMDAKRIVEQARQIIAKEINAEPSEIVFCSGGSEANALAIDGKIDSLCIASKIEHPSITENGNVHIILPVDKYGMVNITDLNKENVVYGTVFAVQLANSEIGTIQNIKEISDYVHNIGCYLHCDATQAFGHIPIDIKELGCDTLTATGQKIGSIPGGAFLYVRNGYKLKSIIHGHQQNGLRAGTENVAAIASLAKAVKLINYEKQQNVGILRNELFYRLKDIYGDKVSLNGTSDMSKRLPNNLSIILHGYESELIIMLLSIDGVCISAGSACSSGTGKPSSTLKAIGLSDEDATSTLRITLSEDTTIDDIDEFGYKLQAATKKLDLFKNIQK